MCTTWLAVDNYNNVVIPCETQSGAENILRAWISEDRKMTDETGTWPLRSDELMVCKVVTHTVYVGSDEEGWDIELQTEKMDLPAGEDDEQSDFGLKDLPEVCTMDDALEYVNYRGRKQIDEDEEAGPPDAEYYDEWVENGRQPWVTRSMKIGYLMIYVEELYDSGRISKEIRDRLEKTVNGMSFT